MVFKTMNHLRHAESLVIISIIRHILIGVFAFFKEAFLKKRIVFLSVTLILLVSACTVQPTQPVIEPTQVVPTQGLVELPTSTPTEVPQRSLVVCMGEEPISLYMYGYSSQVMWSILEAIYDGPFDTVNYETRAVIMEAVPSIENGNISRETVSVTQGDLVQDQQGSLVPLLQGTVVYPAGCQEKNCAVTWDGSSALEMERTTITFNLLPGLVWSDGDDLTAQDSVFSYQIANDPATPVSRYYLDRTTSYSALDSLTVQWQGVPGFRVDSAASLFWLPIPQHLYGDLSPTEMLENEQVLRNPLGWGPYQIDEWVFGDHISLSKNHNYFKADQGLPIFDHLVFRFLGPHADSNLKALEIGECDFIDPSVQLDEQLTDVVERNNLGQLMAYFAQGPEWEHLDFGLLSSDYDDGKQAGQDRPDWFSDVRMRQAIAYCTDRETIANHYFVNRGKVPIGFYPPSHPAYDDTLVPIPYDPEKGMALLEEIGWRDDDQDPTTPRVASGIPFVVDGTPLSLNYVTTQSELRTAISYEYAVSMGLCGIQVTLENVFPTDLYAAGPDGVMFGRNFDLVQFAWTTTRTSPCYLYTTKQIPTEENLWIGANVSGYQNPAFDNACESALSVTPADGDRYLTAHQELQQIFYQDLPVLPLYYHLKTAAGRVDFCGFDSIDVSARSALWNLENYNYGAVCSP